MSKPSIREVAKLAAVSTATVSNVFSGKKPVNEALQKRVRDAANALGYQVDRAASQLRSKRNKVITVLVPNITDTFFATIVSHLENLAFEQGYDVIVASCHDRPEVENSRISALMSWRPAGMIAIPCSGTLSPLLLHLKATCPTVLIDRVAAHEAPFDTVTLDNHSAGRRACQYLSKMGHHRVLIAASNLSFPPIDERAKGALEAMSALGLSTPDVIELGSSVEDGSKILDEWLDKHSRPSVIFALTNVTTLSCLTVFAERDIKVGSDISLLAFDDDAWMSARSVGLTVMRQPAEQMAKNAWSRLLQRVDSEINNVNPVASILKAELIERQSVQDMSGNEKVHSLSSS